MATSPLILGPAEPIGFAMIQDLTTLKNVDFFVV
jgi:hypothetical protein